MGRVRFLSLSITWGRISRLATSHCLAWLAGRIHFTLHSDRTFGQCPTPPRRSPPWSQQEGEVLHPLQGVQRRQAVRPRVLQSRLLQAEGHAAQCWAPQPLQQLGLGARPDGGGDGRTAGALARSFQTFYWRTQYSPISGGALVLQIHLRWAPEGRNGERPPAAHGLWASRRQTRAGTARPRRVYGEGQPWP